MIAMAVCLAWRVAEEEREEHREAEEWLLREDQKAAALRNQLIDEFGRPASAIRPEGGPVWVFFGIVAALTFTLLGWHNWYLLPPSHTATLLIVLNLLTILMSTLILHLGFFGRLLALYSRNYNRVARLTWFLKRTREQDIDSWWNCRNFVLNDDLSIDYDSGGLAVSATFLTDIFVFIILMGQIYREGHTAVLEAPGSYCAYACMYITSCLIKVFTLATNTYEEQHLHISGLMNLSASLSSYSNISFPSIRQHGTTASTTNKSNKLLAQNSNSWHSDDEYNQLQDDGPIDIDDSDSEPHTPAIKSGSRLRSRSEEEYNQAQSPDAADNNTESLELKSGELVDESEGKLNEFDETEVLTLHLPGSISLLEPNPHQSIAVNATNGSSGDVASNSSTTTSQFAVPTFFTTGINISTAKNHVATVDKFSAASNAGLVPPMSPTGRSQLNMTSVAPVLSRSVSNAGTNLESYRQTIAEIISQIRKYDPYPCILGIPVMPALFTSCKFYIFISFVLIGARTMVACLRQL